MLLSIVTVANSTLKRHKALFRCFSLLLDLVMMKSLEFLANKGDYIQAISRSCGTFLDTTAWLFYPTKDAIKLLHR